MKRGYNIIELTRLDTPVLGSRPSIHDYKIISLDTDGYLGSELIFSFRKNILHPDDEDRTVKSLYPSIVTARTSNRGAIAGEVDIKKIKGKNSKIIGLADKGFRTRLVYEDGVSSYYVTNPTKSMIVGYYDRDLMKRSVAVMRETAWTRKHPEKWEEFKKVMKKVEDIYALEVPDKYNRQLYTTKSELGSVYSTATINLNLECCVHKDSHNSPGSFSALFACGNWKGSMLCFPEYKVAIDLRNRDILFFDGQKEWHFNNDLVLEDESCSRMSVVLFQRSGFSVASVEI